jgi:hypothetical protein
MYQPILRRPAAPPLWIVFTFGGLAIAGLALLATVCL